MTGLDAPREVLKHNDPTRPDPRRVETPLTQPAGDMMVMTRKRPCFFFLIEQCSTCKPGEIVLVPGITHEGTVRGGHEGEG